MPVDNARKTDLLETVLDKFGNFQKCESRFTCQNRNLFSSLFKLCTGCYLPNTELPSLKPPHFIVRASFIWIFGRFLLHATESLRDDKYETFSSWFLIVVLDMHSYRWSYQEDFFSSHWNLSKKLDKYIICPFESIIPDLVNVFVSLDKYHHRGNTPVEDIKMDLHPSDLRTHQYPKKLS